jgi:hypothetical protein
MQLKCTSYETSSPGRDHLSEKELGRFVMSHKFLVKIRSEQLLNDPAAAAAAIEFLVQQAQ